MAQPPLYRRRGPLAVAIKISTIVFFSFVTVFFFPDPQSHSFLPSVREWSLRPQSRHLLASTSPPPDLDLSLPQSSIAFFDRHLRSRSHFNPTDLAVGGCDLDIDFVILLQSQPKGAISTISPSPLAAIAAFGRYLDVLIAAALPLPSNSPSP
ncbi:hypothetical protein DFJ73DRAFT_843471 [Zopfochytrium polystomum]|nr:hypothetical protein DFJ73DRAFT_843471 [Zopfochytrium polystomum]